MKKDEFGFGIIKFEMPKRHLSEQVQEAVQKTSLKIKRVWCLKYSLGEPRAEPRDQINKRKSES